MKEKIKVAIVGVGNCASSLIQGVQFYQDHPESTTGLMYPEIGGYSANDINFVVGFDIDERKVARPLCEAIFSKPNCTYSLPQFEANPHLLKNTLDEDGDPAMVFYGPLLDGVAPHMIGLPEDITFKPVSDETKSKFPHWSSETADSFTNILSAHNVDVLLNYLPVGSEEASRFYIENAIKAGVHVVNCMPTYISTEDAMALEKLAVANEVTIVGSDMRSAFGASRLSEVLQGSMLDAGLTVTQHIQMNMAAGSTQGKEHIVNGVSSNTDFLNMYSKDRVENKAISKENVLKGQSTIRDKSITGTTMYAGPSLTVFQRPGGEYRGSDNKICNIDLVAFGWMNARYELTARLSVQDSANSAGIVFDAIRFCKVAQEEGILGYLRGPSAYSQKTPPVQLTSADAKFECDALARRVLTKYTENQVRSKLLDHTLDGKTIDVEAVDTFVSNLEFTFQSAKNDYNM